MSLRITIADDHRIIRIGLRAILESEPDLEVVGEAETAQGALEVVRAERPDVAVIDLNMPDGFGLSIVPAIHEASPSTRILVLTMHAESDIVRRALSTGIHGFVNKGADPDEVARAVRIVGSGRSYLNVPLEPEGLASFVHADPSEAQAGVARSSSTPAPARLSDREREVLMLFVQGYTHREIAERLGLRVKTVETYRSRLGDKFGVRSRSDLVRCAKELGLVAEESPPR